MGGIKRKEYQELLAPLQEELVAMARWVEATGARVVVLSSALQQLALT